LKKMSNLSGIRSSGSRGYSLVELLVILGTVAFISGALAMTYSVVTQTGRMTNEDTVALLQVTEAQRWITTDVQSSDNVTGYSTSAWNCVMNCFNWTGATMSTINVQYVIQDGVLLRKVNGGQGVEIARHLSGPGTDTLFSKSVSENNSYILKIKSVYNDASVSKTYRINKRISGGS